MHHFISPAISRTLKLQYHTSLHPYFASLIRNPTLIDHKRNWIAVWHEGIQRNVIASGSFGGVDLHQYKR